MRSTSTSRSGRSSCCSVRAAAGCAAVLAVGCGRIAFDELVDPSVHDEDGDGVPDVVDVCPHVADPAQLDMDGDRVGDACDLEPTIPRQTILWFFAMNELDPQLELGGTWTQVGDDVVSAPNGGGLRAALPQGGDLEIALAFELRSVMGTAEHQVAVSPSLTDVPRWYTELYEDPTNPAKVSITRT